MPGLKMEIEFGRASAFRGEIERKMKKCISIRVLHIRIVRKVSRLIVSAKYEVFPY